MDLEGKIKISELVPHPSNEYYFDDMVGSTWDDFIQSISTSGVTNAITITQDKIIISGHQRVRACKELGIEEISYKMIDYSHRNEKDQIKDLIESNLRQRVLGNHNSVKLGRCFDFLKDYYGLQNGGDRKSDEKLFHLKSSDAPTTQKQLAETYGITQQTMNNYIRLTKTIPELDDLVQTGIVAPVTARAILKELSPQEQEEMIASMDVTKKITKKQVQRYIEENARLKQQLSRPTPVEVRTVVEHHDTEETLAEIEKLKKKLNEANKEKAKLSEMIIEKQALLSQAMGTNTNYQLVSHCSEITLQMMDFIKEMSKYDYMAESFNEIPSAIRLEYERCITSVQKWSERILNVIHTQENIIDEGECIYE